MTKCFQSIFTCFIASRLPTPSYTALNRDDNDSPAPTGGQTMAAIPDSIFRSLTLGIVLATMTVAFFIQNVETILGLNGALMGSFIGTKIIIIIYIGNYCKLYKIIVLAFILPSLCFKKSCSDATAWSVRMSKVVLLTGIGALLLGVVQNLPQPSVVEIDYPTQIEAEYEHMEKSLNSIPVTVDSYSCCCIYVVFFSKLDLMSHNQRIRRMRRRLEIPRCSKIRQKRKRNLAGLALPSTQNPFPSCPRRHHLAETSVQSEIAEAPDMTIVSGYILDMTNASQKLQENREMT